MSFVFDIFFFRTQEAAQDKPRVLLAMLTLFLQAQGRVVGHGNCEKFRVVLTNFLVLLVLTQETKSVPHRACFVLSDHLIQQLEMIVGIVSLVSSALHPAVRGKLCFAT
jgi:hypothetical protein